MCQTPLHFNHLTRSAQCVWQAVCLGGLLSLASGSWAQTQGARRPAPPPKLVFLVADFRTLALQTHDPSERAAWLGNADSPALMGTIDGMVETREVSDLVTQSKPASPIAASSAVKPQSNETVTAGLAPPRTVISPGAHGPGAAIPVVVPVAVPTRPAD